MNFLKLFCQLNIKMVGLETLAEFRSTSRCYEKGIWFLKYDLSSLLERDIVLRNTCMFNILEIIQDF